MAWTQEARIEARDVTVESVNLKRLASLVPEIRKMTVLDPDAFCPSLKKHLANCGIALVLLPHLSGSFLQGATFMDGKKIVIGITTRGRDADKFWFSLFHEIAHVVLGHVGKAGGISEEDERAANQWAEDALIHKDDFLRFKEDGNYSRESVLLFASKQGIAPGIVVGRLQMESLIPFHTLNDLKTKYEFA